MAKHIECEGFAPINPLRKAEQKFTSCLSVILIIMRRSIFSVEVGGSVWVA